MVKASASKVEDPGFESSQCLGIFPESSHTSDFKIGTLVAIQPGVWRYRVSTGTGWPLHTTSFIRTTIYIYIYIYIYKCWRQFAAQ